MVAAQLATFKKVMGEVAGGSAATYQFKKSDGEGAARSAATAFKV
ncbi:MAG: hypothetical protein Phog2KO_50470 [Phototrophicaceae bacterium]